MLLQAARANRRPGSTYRAQFSLGVVQTQVLFSSFTLVSVFLEKLMFLEMVVEEEVVDFLLAEYKAVCHVCPNPWVVA